MASETRFGLIGCGDIGRLRARALTRASGCRLVAVTDVDAARAKSVAGESGADVLSDWRALVRHEGVDAVVVSTPPHLHAEMCIAAARSGKQVLCEKPLARDAGEARSMVAAAEESGTHLATGFNYRFYPSFVQMRELLSTGLIGELDHVRSYGGYSATSHNQPWVHDAAVVGGGAMRDIGIHLIDLTCDILGDVEEVKGLATAGVWKYEGCEDNGFALLRNSRGVVASLHASWTEWTRYQFRIEAYGSLGCIRATCFPMITRAWWTDRTGGPMRSRTNWFPRSALGEKLFSYRWIVVRSFVQEHTSFLDYIRGKPARIATGADGVRSLEVAQRASEGVAAARAGTAHSMARP